MDERVKGEYRKIYSELVMLIMYFAAGSLLVKFFLLDVGPAGCATEFVILVGAPVYLVIRQMMLGLDPGAGMTRKKRRRKLLVCIVCGLLGFLLVAYAGHGRIDQAALEYVLTYIAVCTFTYYVSGRVLRYFAERKSRGYED